MLLSGGGGGGRVKLVERRGEHVPVLDLVERGEYDMLWRIAGEQQAQGVIGLSTAGRRRRRSGRGGERQPDEQTHGRADVRQRERAKELSHVQLRLGVLAVLDRVHEVAVLARVRDGREHVQVEAALAQLVVQADALVLARRDGVVGRSARLFIIKSN